jgi:parallel beta-helix repeat protein
MQYESPLGGADLSAYVDPNLTTGAPGSIVRAPAIENVMRELHNLIEEAEIVPSRSDLTQVHQSIAKLINIATRYKVPSVKDFGAVGDGVTDDTAAFQLAFETVGAEDGLGELHVPRSEAEYLVTGLEIEVPIKVTFAGAIIKLANASNAIPVKILSSDVQLIGRGTINQNKANQPAAIVAGTPTQCGILADGVDNVTLEGLTVQECKQEGIFLRNCSSSRVARCKTRLTAYTGILARTTTAGDPVTDLVIEGNNVDRSDAAANNEKGIGVTRDSASRRFVAPLVTKNVVKMHASHVGSNPVGIELYGSTDIEGGIVRAKVTENDVEGALIGISVAARSVGCTISENTVYNSEGILIEVADSKNTTVTGNTCDGNNRTPTGIISDGNNFAAKSNSITGNTVLRTIQQALYAISDSPGTVFQGNTVEIAAGWGLRLLSVEDVIANANTVNGLTTSETCCLVDNCSRIRLTANKFVGSANHAIQIVAQNSVACSEIFVGRDNELSATAGLVQTLEVTGGTLASVWLEGRTRSPAQITSNQNNYDAGFEQVLRLSTDATRSLTGMARGFDGMLRRILNVGAQTLDIPNESGSSTAANRFVTGTGGTRSVAAGAAVDAIYDGGTSRWRLVN